MSNLTGQQIQNTYKGLLNLQDSTTGITSTLQAIQDGLGNNTGARIATNYFTARNVPNMDFNIVPDIVGTGFGLAQGSTNPATSENRIGYGIFYDSGVYSYSAMTYQLVTLSTTNDVVNFYFYSLQLVPDIGIAPKNLIMSGITLSSITPSVTGYTTTILPSPLSFSGTGGGYYVFMTYIQNSGTTPTVRYSNPVSPQSQIAQTPFINIPLGTYRAPSGLTQSEFCGYYRGLVGGQYLLDNLTPQLTFSESDIINNQRVSTLTRPNIGFGLKVIK
jgi:hypothetical protein